MTRDEDIAAVWKLMGEHAFHCRSTPDSPSCRADITAAITRALDREQERTLEAVVEATRLDRAQTWNTADRMLSEVRERHD